MIERDGIPFSCLVQITHCDACNMLVFDLVVDFASLIKKHFLLSNALIVVVSMRISSALQSCTATTRLEPELQPVKGWLCARKLRKCIE